MHPQSLDLYPMSSTGHYFQHLHKLGKEQGENWLWNIIRVARIDDLNISCIVVIFTEMLEIQVQAIDTFNTEW